METYDAVLSANGALCVTTTSFDPREQLGEIMIEELSAELGWFYVTVKFGSGSQNRIDYKTWDVYKTGCSE